MRLILTLFVVSVLVAAASAAEVLDLSTLGKKPDLEVVSLPQVSPTMPTIAPTSLGGAGRDAVDLSTLGKKVQTSLPATQIKGSSPITVTPMFAIRNSNITTVASTVFTLPQAISANASVYTPPIAIFGGA